MNVETVLHLVEAGVLRTDDAGLGLDDLAWVIKERGVCA